jgi:transglutaminase-like putative cysteine protease
LDFGGGKINRKSIAIVLMLTVAIMLCISSAAAATTTNNTVRNATAYQAAGSTTTTTATTVTVTISQLDKSSESVKKFIETNKRLPNYVTISGKQISTAQFLTLLSYGVINLNSGKTTSITLKKSVNAPPSPTQTAKSGTITKANYVKYAGNLKTFIEKNGRIPNFLATTSGNMRYESLVYMYSKIIVFYGDNKRLPNTVSVTPWTVKSTSEGSTTTDLSQYLKSTTDAPSSNTTIKNLAASITKGKTTTYAKAQAIFNWVRDNLTYSFYYNTIKGALGALSSRSANCCDTTHLLVALTRAAGIAARYQHGECQFSSGWFGHVWAQVYVDGKWYNADAIGDSNTFGTIKNWNTNTVKLKGTYATLPF